MHFLGIYLIINILIYVPIQMQNSKGTIKYANNNILLYLLKIFKNYKLL